MISCDGDGMLLAFYSSHPSKLVQFLISLASQRVFVIECLHFSAWGHAGQLDCERAHYKAV